MSRWDDFGYYPQSQPKQVKDGIKAQSKKGGFGKNWWAKRWIAVLEGFRIGARLSRGRSYARAGQVLSVEIGKGTVKARVQGSRVRPYKVEIAVKMLSAAEWDELTGVLAERPIYVAALLAGNMPPDIEQAFTAAGLSLFPDRYGDLTTKCSCPDYANPCKHIAAVYYLLGEEFDRDPFLIFRLRGRDRDELIAGLSRESESANDPDSVYSSSPAGTGVASLPNELGTGVGKSAKVTANPQVASMAIDSTLFWQGGVLPAGGRAEVSLPTQPAALIKQLGNFPFWRGSQDLNEFMVKIYSDASQTGLDVAVRLASPGMND